MRRTIVIALGATADLHRVRNFAEDLSLALKAKGWGSLPMADADSAIDRLRITGFPVRKLRRALSLVDEIIERHRFGREVTVTYGSATEQR
jgi:hypothetical protein